MQHRPSSIRQNRWRISTGSSSVVLSARKDETLDMFMIRARRYIGVGSIVSKADIACVYPDIVGVL